MKCLICNKETKREKYCSSNCWNKDHRKECNESQKRFRNKFLNYYAIEYQRRLKINPNHSSIRRKKWKENNPEGFRESQVRKHENEKKDKIKKKARQWGYKKRDNQCKDCGGIENLQFHHTDYKNNLGITLCQKCHIKLNKRRFKPK